MCLSSACDASQKFRLILLICTLKGSPASLFVDVLPAWKHAVRPVPMHLWYRPMPSNFCRCMCMCMHTQRTHTNVRSIIIKLTVSPLPLFVPLPKWQNLLKLIFCICRKSCHTELFASVAERPQKLSNFCNWWLEQRTGWGIWIFPPLPANFLLMRCISQKRGFNANQSSVDH